MYSYTSPLSNSTYFLNNCNNNTFDAAETACNAVGGHLVSYGSHAEQQDVEGYYVSLGEAACDVYTHACCCELYMRCASTPIAMCTPLCGVRHACTHACTW
jgi:hypothetical protein